MGNSLDDDKRRSDKEAEAQRGEPQALPEKLPYPKQVFFIVGNEFCERFSYYGMKAILVIYFKSKLHFSEDDATVIYHTFSLFCYFTPLLGALLADIFFGKFKTIISISIIYILGHLMKTLAAITPLHIPPVEFSMIGLALIALGTGGIKPCVAAFGGDQFKLPDQERQLQTFFSVFYFAINIGSLASTLITPILKKIPCFESDTCYSLAFGVPAALMLIATLILIAGKPFYVFKPPQGNVLTQVFGSIWHAIKRKFSPGPERASHWLDPAKEKYDAQLVEDTKILLRVLTLFLPLPVFWALFDQQGSRWTFQATRMNGQLGSLTIIPDQMQLVNSAFIIILIPIFDGIIYPLFAKINFFVKPLQRITVGGLLAALAFFISGILELELEKTYERLPVAGTGHINLMNTLPCHLSVNIKSGKFVENFELNATLNHILYNLQPGIYELDIKGDNACESKQKSISFNLTDKEVKGIFTLRGEGNDFSIYESQIKEDPKKPDNTYPKIRAFFGVGSADNQTLIMRGDVVGVRSLNSTVIDEDNKSAESEYITVEPDKYKFFLAQDGVETEIGSLVLLQGGVYTFTVSGAPGSKPSFSSFILTKENSIHMLWLIPQYFVITVGEILFSITGLEFSYSRAPSTMKSVVQAAWLWTVAFGNLIVIIVAKSKSGMSQSGEFFLFGALMIVDMLLFAYLAFRFQNVDAAKKRAESIDNLAVDSMPMEDRKQQLHND